MGAEKYSNSRVIPILVVTAVVLGVAEAILLTYLLSR